MSNLVEFLSVISGLKYLRRTGWVMRGIENAETVAAHSWRMALMALMKEREITVLGGDINHIIEMCLLHDVGEVVIGDIVPEEHQHCEKKISRDEKKRIEQEAISQLAIKYDFMKLKDIFDEYEKQESINAKIVKNLDKLDMLLQAYEYIMLYGEDKQLNEFMEFNEKDVTLSIFINDLAEIKRRQFDKIITKNEFIDFQILAGKLKHIKKDGCEKINEMDCCDVASHCFVCGLIVVVLGRKLNKIGIDVEKLIKFLIVKDIKEVFLPNKGMVFGIKDENVIDVSLIEDIEVFEYICRYIKCVGKSFDNNIEYRNKISSFEKQIRNELFLDIIKNI
jgi:putative hydrolase of HD superfamily